jgi:hypothetical protein
MYIRFWMVHFSVMNYNCITNLENLCVLYLLEKLKQKCTQTGFCNINVQFFSE